jgi:hypothetical protein
MIFNCLKWWGPCCMLSLSSEHARMRSAASRGGPGLRLCGSGCPLCVTVSPIFNGEICIPDEFRCPAVAVCLRYMPTWCGTGWIYQTRCRQPYDSDKSCSFTSMLSWDLFWTLLWFYNCLIFATNLKTCFVITLVMYEMDSTNLGSQQICGAKYR